MEIREVKEAMFMKLILKSFRDVQTRLALLISIVVYVCMGNKINTQKVSIAN